ncbi:MAG TPA: DUF423 domain-containing protein [Pinirhizobacter sp.]|uniref:DUF423 domain-containing protein n=1 Tax=Pinirhizobacter sp. TaxID=2950432 RepID=UPI002CF5B986|nr:DUF423 domain-containing protein [Pinirhizobacter sp.]HMH68310.1 DUF423 domain-containing protein [Pinirhizobacter sp.]
MRQPVPISLAVLVAVAGASGVICGAFGAHALRGVVDDHALDIWRTGVDYHLWHALALGVALAGGAGPWRTAAAWLFFAGVVLFSGSLYALALGAPRLIGVVTPFGGVAFIAGWIALAVSMKARADHT